MIGKPFEKLGIRFCFNETLFVPVFLCFIDLCKAYNSVNRNLLWVVLRRVYKFSEKFVSIIEALHKETYGVVRFEGQVESGVKQGDVLAPTLFNLFFRCYHKDCHDKTFLTFLW